MVSTKNFMTLKTFWCPILYILTFLSHKWSQDCGEVSRELCYQDFISTGVRGIPAGQQQWACTMLSEKGNIRIQEMSWQELSIQIASSLGFQRSDNGK